MADATNAIAEGEVLQLMNARDPNTSEERYLDVIHRKTARLFQAAAQIGAVLGDAPPDIEDSLARYGKHIGTAFQLVDDALDYQADEASLGKHLGDDLAEGKPTLPLIYALQHGNDDQRAMIRACHRRRRPWTISTKSPAPLQASGGLRTLRASLKAR